MRAIEVCAGTGSLVDGAVALAESALTGAADGTVRPPVEVVLHVDADTLEGHTEAGDGIPAETCRRILCDAGIVPLAEDGSGKTIDVGRKSRTIPTALRRVLHARDGGCRYPGCTNRRFLDTHHVRHWIDGGETSLSNTHLLCRRHHRRVHEFGFTVTVRDGELVFFDPDGREIPSAPARSPLPECPVERLRTELLRSGIEISAESNAPGWDGEPVDYDSCVGALMG
jgi:hypothetical protein